MPREPIQLQLFLRLPVPDAAPTLRSASPRRQAVRVVAAAHAEQLAFAFTLRALQDDADDEWDYPVRRVVSASEAAPVTTAAPSSIFDVPTLMRMSNALKLNGRTGHDEVFRQPVSAVQRAGGVARVVGAAYPANRWTPEREEAERERRARQKPPKPPKGAKTRGKKVREWDGEGAQ